MRMKWTVRPAFEAKSPGVAVAFGSSRARLRHPRLPLKAASFRTWPGSRAHVAQDPTVNAARGALTPTASPSERDSAPLERIAGYRAPLIPRLARSAGDPTLPA